MRLIDADALIARDKWRQLGTDGYMMLEEAIRNAPTVDVSTVDAIPVDFIEAKADEYESASEMEFNTNGGYLDGNHGFYGYCAIRDLLDEWEKKKK